MYWIAQNRGAPEEAHAFPTRELAVHFVDHRTEGWAVGNGGTGWTVYQCSAIAEHRPW